MEADNIFDHAVGRFLLAFYGDVICSALRLPGRYSDRLYLNRYDSHVMR